jgi:hypothetical protein
MHIISTNLRYNNLIHSGNKYTSKGNHNRENLSFIKEDTNWLQTKDVPPNRRHCCSKSQQQCHPRARAMNPQGWFQSVTWLPKPVNTQALTGFSNTHNNPSTQLSSTQPAPPKRMDLHPSLPRSPSGSPSPSRAPVQLVQNLHAGTLRTHSYEQR